MPSPEAQFEELMVEAKEYCTKRGISLSSLSQRALGNTYALDRLEAKAGSLNRRMQTIRDFIEKDPKIKGKGH